MVAALYSGVLSLIYVLLSVRVIAARHKYKIALGDGGNFKLLRKIRAQQNFIEYTPIFLILLVHAALLGIPQNLIHLFGSSFILARISHAYGISKGEIYKYQVLRKNVIYRAFGMFITLTNIITLTILIIYITLPEIF